jgi:hypothetical protein
MVAKEEIVMIEIGETLVSLDFAEKKFCCDIAACKGACCIAGDAGAPLAENEAEEIQSQYAGISGYMSAEGRKAVELTGFYYIDDDHEKVTTLIEGKACAYSVIDTNGIAKCAIEMAYNDKCSTIRKPISCYLYPARLTRYRTFTAVNYDEWDICAPARKKGAAENISVLSFLKGPLEQMFGEKWYDELGAAAEQLKTEI